MRRVQVQRSTFKTKVSKLDLLMMATRDGAVCISVLTLREQQLLGMQSGMPRHTQIFDKWTLLI